MIIQCRKCETRFRFDDQLMQGDGVWVRCSRCKHVFFEGNPRLHGGDEATEAETAREIPAVRISDARRIAEDRFDVNAELSPPRATYPGDTRPERTGQPAAGTLSPLEREPEILRADEGLGDRPQGEAAEEVPVEEDGDEETAAAAGSRRWLGRTLRLFLWVLLAILLSGSVALWLFPEVRKEVLEWAAPGLRTLPGVERYFAPAPSPEPVPAPVRLKEIRQRSVANLLAGNLQVIEGLAVNQAPYAVSRIRVRLTISDAYDVLLGERIVYAGNILSDTELGALAEGEIQRELSIPQGTDVANERIAPNGQIPFMIVFTQEQAGAIKTVVSPAGAERTP